MYLDVLLAAGVEARKIQRIPILVLTWCTIVWFVIAADKPSEGGSRNRVLSSEDCGKPQKAFWRSCRSPLMFA